MIREVLVCAGKRFAIANIFRLEILAVRGKDVFGFLPGRGRAYLQPRERL